MKSLILADIHANLAALEAVLEREADRDEVIFLGDAIGAGPQPNEVLDRLSELDGIFILGNHDTRPFEIQYPADLTNPDRLYMKWTRDQISSRNRAFLRSLPHTRAIERTGLEIRLHHGHFPRRIGPFLFSRPLPKPVDLLARGYARYVLGGWDSRIWPDAPSAVFAALARKFKEPYILLAHSHVQFRRTVGNTCFINPGSVGQQRLGQPVACYAVLEDGDFDLRATPYDFERTCGALDRVPLENGFVCAWKAAYRSGYLPDRYRIRDWRPLLDRGYR